MKTTRRSPARRYKTDRAYLEARVREQQAWIDQHGRTRTGYVANYGSATDAEHYGDGGEAIYSADRAYLLTLLTRLAETR